jgi:hypothetical protein
MQCSERNDGAPRKQDNHYPKPHASNFGEEDLRGKIVNSIPQCCPTLLLQLPL